MRIIICGGRDYTDIKTASSQLDAIHAFTPITGVISGGAKGADFIGEVWARHHNIPLTVVPAQWDIYGKSAGYKRNVQMARLKPDQVIAFPGGKGTQHMRDIAFAHDIPVINLS